MRRLNNCLENKKYTNIPIWFMRQAGRYLREFREIRKKNPDFINSHQENIIIFTVVVMERMYDHTSYIALLLEPSVTTLPPPTSIVSITLTEIHSTTSSPIFDG